MGDKSSGQPTSSEPSVLYERVKCVETGVATSVTSESGTISDVCIVIIAVI